MTKYYNHLLLLGALFHCSVLFGQSLCSGGFAAGYPCNNMDLMSFTPLSSLGGGFANDIWGWTDPLNGKEYAIMGKTNGTVFLDISDPVNPLYLGSLAPHANPSTWRDIKVYANHAFIVSEAGGSNVQVFDLTQLRNVVSPPVAFTETSVYSSLANGNAHNIVINETTGYAYTVGTNSLCSGGLVFLDISNPLSISSPGCFGTDGYTHDAHCIIYLGPDSTHIGKEICFASNEDTQTIVDVDDKSDPQMLSRTGYVNSRYTHQGWVTNDHRFLIFDDELDEFQLGLPTTTHIWNIEDLDNPVILGTFTHPTVAIDHNQYIYGNYTYQSNYKAGLRMLELSDLPNAGLTEVAFFDTFTADDNVDFNGGTWSNYPFFRSGNIIISDRLGGLFIVRANIPRFVMAGPDTMLVACQPDDVVFNVQLSDFAGFSQQVSLTTSNIPTGVTASLSATSVAPNGTVTLTIGNTSNLNPGKYSVRLTGTAGGVEHTISMGLKIAVPPVMGSLILPGNGASNQPTTVDLVWSGIQDANSYEVEVATDAAFNNIVNSASGLSGTTYQASGLSFGTTYFWRIRGVNLCGPGTYSGTFSFTTNTFLAQEILNISTQISDDGINIYWVISEETLNEEFVLERKTSFSDFQPIYEVQGSGSSILHFHFLDEQVVPGLDYYYRIKMVKNNGSSIYSDIVTAKIDEKPFSVSIYPNPVHDKLRVRMTGAIQKEIQILINDPSGKNWYSRSLEILAGLQTIEIALSGLPSGVYFLNVVDNQYRTPIRFLKLD